MGRLLRKKRKSAMHYFLFFRFVAFFFFLTAFFFFLAAFFFFFGMNEGGKK